MPLEIRELQINVSVEPAAKGEQQAAGAPAGGNVKEEMLNECVEQVINTLNQKKER